MSSTKSWSLRPKPKDSSSRPSHHTSTGGFRNPWPSASSPSIISLLQSSFPLSVYPKLSQPHPSIHDIKVVTPDWGVSDLQRRNLERENCIIATTLGHAGVITELPLEGTRGKDGKRESFYVVFDPIFSSRAGPTSYTGPGRLRGKPCEVRDLPGCHAICISHNHYDHLDLPTIQALFTRFPKAKYFVPLGNKTWFLALGIAEEDVVELDWWEEKDCSVRDLGFSLVSEPESGSEDPDLDQDQESEGQRKREREGERETRVRFTCIPAQHNSGRSGLDQGQTLWCGWMVEQLLIPASPSSSSSSSAPQPSNTPKIQVKGTIYHAGDTGYRPSSSSTITCPIFPQINQLHGPLDIAYLPIWRGGSLGFISTMGLRLSHKDIPSTFHGSPADAIEIHREVGSRFSVGIHFGTFVGSENESLEAVLEFEDARSKAGLGRLSDVVKEDEKIGGEEERLKGRAGVLDIGGSIAVEIKARDANVDIGAEKES
ncbi:uncharacterized protein RSE6_10417 [Rhynchosporium secalis]|uniref:Metallo-beta-lactamase domain-containing protein n=1 Tax=Rhynchosporium secalis TaxID=38038 RepID=A0A1E1MKD2_RHYSE|nr:uncharacterized protein RSE6_10417 [Rhynchosporium secalis]